MHKTLWGAKSLCPQHRLMSAKSVLSGRIMWCVESGSRGKTRGRNTSRGNGVIGGGAKTGGMTDHTRTGTMIGEDTRMTLGAGKMTSGMRTAPLTGMIGLLICQLGIEVGSLLLQTNNK